MSRPSLSTGSADFLYRSIIVSCHSSEQETRSQRQLPPLQLPWPPSRATQLSPSSSAPQDPAASCRPPACPSGEKRHSVLLFPAGPRRLLHKGTRLAIRSHAT